VIADPSNEPLVSTASVWEIAIKRSLGKIEVPELPARILDAGFSWLPVGSQHAWAVRDLPLHHRDPFDRLLVTQALVEEIRSSRGTDGSPHMAWIPDGDGTLCGAA
jgi:PIN domain nuclease of toxin-antitoxin system